MSMKRIKKMNNFELKALRKNMMIEALDVSDFFGISKRYYLQVEKGDRNIPKNIQTIMHSLSCFHRRSILEILTSRETIQKWYKTFDNFQEDYNHLDKKIYWRVHQSILSNVYATNTNKNSLLDDICINKDSVVYNLFSSEIRSVIQKL